MSFPGIPPLLNNIASLGNKITLLVADAQLILGLFAGVTPQWGIYLDGEPAIKPDSVISIEEKLEWRIANYPMQDGAFQSYNKVKVPRTIRLRMTKGGSDDERTQFLSTLFEIGSSLDVFDVYMPEVTIPSMNIEHYDYRRTASNGRTLLAVDIWLQEIMVTVAPAFTNTATASGNSPVAGGTVQTTTPSPAEQAAARIAGIAP